MLNDLTIAEGLIYANRYFDNRIFKIDSISGIVLKTYDLHHLVNAEYAAKTLTPQQMNDGYVLNGITYHQKRKIFVVTGKNWGHYYEILLD